MKMLSSKVFISVLVLCCIENSYGKIKVCSDCVVLQSCPSALQIAVHYSDHGNRKKLIESYCGFEYSQSNSVMKVCCSDFAVSDRNVDTTAIEDAIETHPNINLLPKSCGDIDVCRIVGNDIAGLYEFPWMALLFSYISPSRIHYKCTGTIINSKYILTSGNCVAGHKKNKIIGVRIGELDINNRVDCHGLECETHLQDIQVENIIPHPNFTSPGDPQNDLALIRLRKPIDFNYKNAKPICLPVTQKLRNVYLAGRTATVTNWDFNDILSGILSKGYVSIKTDEECVDFLNSKISYENQTVLKEICAEEYLRHNCKSDSGSPLMVQGVYGGRDRYIQYGIASVGLSECGLELGVYTDITKFMEWILDNIRE